MDIDLIVKQCQAGDREAFGTLYRAYLMQMHKVVAHYVNDKDVVWDILHDGFIIAFQAIGSMKNTSKLKSWLTSIMKNLALQYIREESSHKSITLSEITSIYESDDNQVGQNLTWAELDSIIGKLPDSYSKIFKLSVLDGLSHKEIGELLGIAPHSSSSQLARAKAMLRRWIIKYRVETDIVSFIGIILLLWHGIFRHRDERPTEPITNTIADVHTPILPDSTTDIETVTLTKHTISQRRTFIADEITPRDSTYINENDSVTNDASDTPISIITHNIDNNKSIADVNLSQKLSNKALKWSMSLAYVGNSGERELNRYMITNPYQPDGEDTDEEISVLEKTHHYMPVVISLSIDKSLNPRWSIESGLRYTFLRSDKLYENILERKETIQRIHYIGVPLKIKYRIFEYNDFSIYGQSGGGVDIPVVGRQNTREYSSTNGVQNNLKIKVGAPVQWSVESGIGVEYNFTKSISIYTEPSVHYYFNTASDIKTIRQEKPIEFYIPIGMRVRW